MSRPLAHSRARNRDRIAKNGADDITDFSLPAGLSPPRKRKSKADQRAELAQAEARISRIVLCPCGHRATVAIPAAWIGTKMLRCSECGERSQA